MTAITLNRITDAEIQYAVADEVSQFVTRISKPYFSDRDRTQLQFAINEKHPFPEYPTREQNMVVIRERMNDYSTQMLMKIADHLPPEKFEELTETMNDVRIKVKDRITAHAQAYNSLLDAVIAMVRI